MTDQRMTFSLVEQFETLLRHRLSGNQLWFCEGGIMLQGHGTSYYVKQLAQHAAIEVTGLRVLSNEIENAVSRGAR
jgi:hypothetical protein